MQHGGGHHNMAMMMDDSACGYCVLLLHAPLLDVSHAPLFWSRLLASRPPPIHYLVPLFAHVVHTELQPRAPVSFLLFNNKPIAVLCIAVDRFNPAELIRPTVNHRDDIINPVISTLMELTPYFPMVIFARPPHA